MKRFLFVLAGLLSLSAGARAQQAPLGAAGAAELIPTPHLLRNSITNLHAEGDSLWVGPFLSLTIDGGQTWLVADVDSLFGSPRNRLFSLDVEGDVVWAGLGFTSSDGGQNVPAAGGFLVSTDGGATFRYRLPQLDDPGDDAEPYGGSILEALPIIVPQQSPPFDIDYDPNTGDVWVAGWASGIRRSSDEGRTWQRVVLPPDAFDFVTPDSSYDFLLAPQRGPSGNLNHMGFAVLVDEAGTIWAGTPAGINRSIDGGQSWQRFSADGTSGSLTGSWVISVEEQPLPGRNPVWMASWNAGEAGEQGVFGITVTRDGGETFEQVLRGERIYDFAFRGTTVYAAGENGLFITEDDGLTWRGVRHFDVRGTGRVVRPDVSAFSVATTRDALWVGTSDGLLKSTDGGATWALFRTEVPLHPATPTAEVPDVETYAYPNPFSPPIDRFVRIRYELPAPRGVEVRVFDFGMNLVRRLREEGRSGANEITWDGTDDGGLRVANGVYFYTVRAGEDTVWGKIQVLE